jgi:hypothetical protein
MKTVHTSCSIIRIHTNVTDIIQNSNNLTEDQSHGALGWQKKSIMALCELLFKRAETHQSLKRRGTIKLSSRGTHWDAPQFQSFVRLTRAWQPTAVMYKPCSLRLCDAVEARYFLSPHDHISSQFLGRSLVLCLLLTVRCPKPLT